MDIFEIMGSFDPENAVDKKKALCSYLWGGNETRATSLLNRMGMFDRSTARDCLNAALATCSVELFGKLLDHTPRGEYAGWWAKPWTPPELPEQNACQVAGVLTTLAAAMGKAEHLRLLLDWGCDVNGASPDAASALANTQYMMPGYKGRAIFHGVPTVRSKSAATWRSTSPTTVIPSLTPLAAGIAFGNLACVQLLLEREGVWLTEAPAVSEALALRGEPWDNEAYRTCRRLLCTRADGSPRPLCLWAAVHHMNVATLRDELERCTYDREELVRAALEVERCGLEWRERWAVYAVFGERYPDVLRDERFRRQLAGWICYDVLERENPLPEVAEQTLGDTIDLDESFVGTANFSASSTESCLRRLGKERRLVMSRDAIYDPSSVTASYLRVLLHCVEFRAPSLPIGVSALTAAILQTGDVKLLRFALERGLIPAEEPSEKLLELAGKNVVARALLLTWRRPSLGLAPAGAERYSRRVLSEDEEKRVLADPALRAMASDALLFTLLEHRDLRETPDEVMCWGGFETKEYTALCALRGETDIVLRCAMVRDCAIWRPNTVVVEWAGPLAKYCLSLTLLCCAAAGGQTETVRALLDTGLDPEERNLGQLSIICSVDDRGDDEEKLSLPPLLGALLWARWDTARLLLERGAQCDLTSYTVRRAFENLRGGDVPYADIRRELGAYLEGRRLRRMN